MCDWNNTSLVDESGKVYGVASLVQDITDRKQAENKIRQLIESYDRITDNADEAIFKVEITEGGGKIVYMNLAAERIFGYTQADWDSDPDFGFKIIHPDYAEKYGQVLEQISTLKKPIKNIVLGWIAKGGREVFVEYTIIPIIDTEGNITHFESIGRDITERRQAETVLHKHAMEQNILLNVSKSVSNTLDLETVLQTISDSAAELLDIETTAIYLLEEEELLLGATTPPLDLQMPETLRRAQLTDHPHILEAVTTRTPVILLDTRQAELSQAEQNIVKNRNLRSLIFLPFLQEEKVIGVLILGTIDRTRKFSREEVYLCQTISNQLALGVQNARLHTGLIKYANELEDQITERKLAEEALLESEVCFRTIYENAPVLINAFDENGGCVLWNKQCRKIFGWTIDGDQCARRCAGAVLS